MGNEFVEPTQEGDVTPAVIDPVDTGAGQTADEETATVPLAELQALVESDKTGKEKIAEMSRDLQTARDQATFASRQMQLRDNASSPNTEPDADIGDDAIVYGKDFKTAVKKAVEQGLAPVMQHVGQLSNAVANPGALEELKTHLPKILEDNPDLASVIQSSPNPQATALAFVHLAKKSAGKGPKTDPEKTVVSTIERILTNAKKPGSPSAATGGSVGIEDASRISKMSAGDFKQYVDDVKAGRRAAGS